MPNYSKIYWNVSRETFSSFLSLLLNIVLKYKNQTVINFRYYNTSSSKVRNLFENSAFI
jgi:hypothetical protein